MKSLKIAAAVLVLFAVGVAFKYMFVDRPESQADPKSAAFLSKRADKIKHETTLPQMAFQDAVWYDVTGKEGMLVYSYRLITVYASEFDTQRFLPRWRQQAIEHACRQDNNSLYLLKQGVVLRYSYVDKSDAWVASFDVNLGDCDAPTTTPHP